MIFFKNGTSWVQVSCGENTYLDSYFIPYTTVDMSKTIENISKVSEQVIFIYLIAKTPFSVNKQ